MKNKFKIFIILTTIIFVGLSNVLLINEVFPKQEDVNNLVSYRDDFLSYKKFKRVDEYGNSDKNEYNCKEMLGSNVVKLINLAYLVLEIAAPILFIVLAMVDFTGAITAQDRDALKKAFQKAIKRLIPVVFIFLLPILIKFIGWIANLDVSCIS